jgi:radical SAM protein with 4Fe4S-binding SPASM domain
MRFSIDGITEETYQKNRPGGSFRQVYRNMQTAVNKARGTQLKLTWQFIAMRNNEHEIERAKDTARDLGIEFYIKTFAQTVPEMVPVNPAYRRRLLKKPCTDIYRILYVFYNGDVVICCYDIEGKYAVGNIKNNTLLQIWNSKIYRQLRDRVDRALSYPEKEPLICKSCLKWGDR